MVVSMLHAAALACTAAVGAGGAFTAAAAGPPPPGPPSAAGHASFVSLAAHPLARCLDGTHSGYYIRPATHPAAADSWLFLLDGGGICTTKADCLSRSTTKLGSSKSWPAVWNLSTTALTTNSPKNPFHAFNVVYLQYCDGSMHSGARTAPSAETFGLW